MGVCVYVRKCVCMSLSACVCLFEKLDSKMIKALEMDVSSSKTFLVLILNNLQVLLV